MGVKKLTTFVDQNYQWQTKNLSQNKIVIDGYSLCYQLYFANHRRTGHLGGDYHEFYLTVRDYFYRLQYYSIEPHIVMDGVYHDRCKDATLRQRYIDRNKSIAKLGSSKFTDVLPLFGGTVFIDAIRDMRLKFVVSDGEADSDIVSLANHLRCPVLSNDSDYYIFNLECGYIPLNNSYRSMRNGSRVRVFYYREFDRQFGFMDHDLRLLLPVFLGNDFYRQPLTIPILDFGAKTPAEEVVHFLCGYRSVKKVFVDIEPVCGGIENIKKRMEHATQFYRIPSNSIDKLANSKQLLQMYPSIPNWALCAYKEGDFNYTLMSFLASHNTKRWEYINVIEDMNQPSAWEFTSHVQHYMIGALIGPETDEIQLLETIRPPPTPQTGIQHTLNDIEVTLYPMQRCRVQLENIPRIPIGDRRKILLRVFHSKGIMKSIERKIPTELCLPIIASHYWLKSCPTYLEYLHPLICCILTCYGEQRVPGNTTRQTFEEKEFRTYTHAFAHWQCTLHHAIAFNQVLCGPFQYISPAHVYSGSVLRRYYRLQLQQPDTMDKSVSKLAQTLIDVVTKGLV